MRKLLLIQRYAILTLLGLIGIFAVPLCLSIMFDSEHPGKPHLRDPASDGSAQNLISGYVDDTESKRQKVDVTEASWALPVKDIECGQAQDLGFIDSDMVRLKVKDCDGFSPLSFLNTTNGYNSEAIATRKGEYTSDYVDLKVGNNKIEVVRTSKDGAKKTQIVTVERRIREAANDEND